jgi:DNA-dependent protein kinase catalytic subunit
MVARALLAKTPNEIVPGNKAIQDFCRRAYKIRTEILISNDTKTEELFRQFNCAAYSALCALICSTQTKIDFYTILFKEHAPKNEFIWKKIINLKDDTFYNPAYFQLDEYRKIRHNIVSIRKSPDAAPNFVPGQQSPKYIQSQQIFDSSLTDDVKNLDMNHVMIRTDAEVLAKMSNPVQNNVQITLKKSRINEHEVMPIICGVIKHMFENKITPVPEFENFNTPAPAWVSEICAVIEDERQENYVRLFLVTVIYNTKEFMKHYASTVTGSVLKLIADGCAGTMLNQFIIDLIVMLLSWNEKYIPSNPADRSYASSVLTFLMQHAYNEQKDVFKLNLELIKVYIELWKAVIIVPMQLLYDSLNRSTRFDSRDNICGLQLNSIILANSLVPWTDQTKDVFLQAVVICLENDYDIVYKPAAELMGMCLQQLDPDADDALMEIITAKLFAFKKKDENKFRSTLYGLHKHYPNIVDPFLTIVAGNISTAVGAFKRMYLEMFLTRVEVLGDKIYREISMFGINNLLKQYEFQILALHIVNKALPHMKGAEISVLLKEISNFVDINRNDCRDLMFEILMYIRNKNQQNEQDIKTVNQILLKGLALDTDNDICNRIFNFWSSNEQILSQSIEKRFTDLMANMYDTKCEKQFISICAQYLLEIPINNPNSKRQICQYQNNVGIKLTEYQLDTTFRSFNSRATPLFVESQQKNLMVGEGSQQMHHVLKQTQAVEGGGMFEPTQVSKKKQIW